MNRKVEFIGREKELKTISKLISQNGEKHILFLEADGGIGKTRFLQEIQERYLVNQNIILNEIIDRDDYTLFSIDVLKKLIIKQLGSENFKQCLALEKEFVNNPANNTLYKKMKKSFVDSFNLLTEEKKFIFFIDTAEKIKSNRFWREAIELVSKLENFFVIISGRYITINEKYLTQIDSFLTKIELKPFSDEDASLYFQKKSELENIKPISKELLDCLIMLSDGKPILLDLTAEWILKFGSKDAPEEFIANKLNLDMNNCLSFVTTGMSDVLIKKQKEFEKNLVIHYQNISNTTQQIIILLTSIPKLNLEMVEYIITDEDNMLDEAFDKTKEFVFIKDLQSGYIRLHDEMKRLLDDYAIPMIDSDGKRREGYIKKIIPYFEKKIAELKNELKTDTTDDYSIQLKLKKELNSNIIELVEYLFLIETLLEKAMSVLEDEFFYARYRNNFRLMKALISHSVETNMNIKQKANFIRMKAESLSMENKNREAKKLIEDCKKEHRESLDELDIAGLDNILAGINNNMSELIEAKKNQLNAFRIFKKNSVIDAIAPTANHIGVIYRNMGYLDKSIYYHKEALKYGKDTLDMVFRGYVFDNLAESFREKGEYNNALDNARTAMILWRKEKSIKQAIIARGNVTLGNINRDIGKHHIAYDFYQKARNMLNENAHLKEILNLYINIGKFYWFKYEESKNTHFLDKAKKYCLDADRLSRENHHYSEQIQALSHLSNIYWDENNRDKALKTVEEFYRLSKEHSISYYTVDAILGFIEFGYEMGLNDIQVYVEELKEYEKEYNFPHFFGRMRKYQAHILFDNKKYDKAIELYAKSLIMLSKHGGYSKYSVDSELDNLSKRLKRIEDRDLLLKLVNSLHDIFIKDANKKLIDWSENKLLQIEYGV